MYGKGTNTSNNCDVVLNAEKFLEHIKKEGLCFNCLGKYRVSQYTSQSHCKKYNSKHHTSICSTDGRKPKQLQPKDHKTQPNETNSKFN